MTIVSMDVDCEEFQNDCVLFAWLSNTRPDTAYSAGKPAQVSNQRFYQQKLNTLNRGIRMVRRTLSRTLFHLKLDKHIFEFKLNSDASYAANDDFFSAWFLNFLLKDTTKVHVSHHSSLKYKRSVLLSRTSKSHPFMCASNAVTVLAADV